MVSFAVFPTSTIRFSAEITTAFNTQAISAHTPVSGLSQWDDDKAAENFRKHGVSFEEAAYALGDPFSVEIIDDRELYGEERIIALAAGKTGILVVIHTERPERTRIISARKAKSHEQDTYYIANGA